MRLKVVVLLVGFGAAAALWPGWTLRVGEEASTAGPMPAALAAVGAPKLSELYGDWVAHHESTGGDRDVRFPLHRSDIREHRIDADSTRGSVHLDAIEGRVAVHAANLPEGEDYDVWLIDDRPAPGNSIQPDASDEYVHAGSLLRAESGWSLEAALGAETFAAFQVDQVAVTKRGTHPTEGSVLRGGPEFFQQLYTSLRTPQLAAVSDWAKPESESGWMLDWQQASAARQVPAKPIIVDPDVVLDDLIRLGADLFINENFDGNGRTCETCHPFLNNITIDAAELARRPDNDPIFIAEFDPVFASEPFDLDIPVVLRTAALIGIKEDGLDRPSVNRSVPHLFAVNRSFGPVAPVVLPFGAPGAPPTPFPLPDPNDPAARTFGLELTMPVGATELGGPGGPGAGFPMFGFTIDNSSQPPLARLGFGGDLSMAPDLGLFGRLGDAVPGAIVTLFNKSPARIPGVDFRLPTPEEVAAITAFYMTLGTDKELDLTQLQLTDPIAEFGRKVFMNPGGQLASFPGGQVIPMTDDLGNTIGAGKCNVCHNNAGALSDPVLFDAICNGLALMVDLPFSPKCGGTNFNFETGVETLPAQPARIVAGSRRAVGFPPGQGRVVRDSGGGVVPHIPGMSPADVAAGNAPCFTVHPDERVDLPAGGFGTVVGIDFPFTDPPVLAGQCSEEFSTPRLVEAADTPPFFHNNNASTLEGAIEFYNTKAFRESSAGIILGAITDGQNGITLENTEIQAIASFLRVINAMENLRSAIEFSTTAVGRSNRGEFRELLSLAVAQAEDASMVLEQAQLNTAQVDLIRAATDILADQRDRGAPNGRGRGQVNSAIAQLSMASAGLRRP